MKEQKLLESIGKIDDSFLEEAMEVPIKKRGIGLKWGIVAACLCLLISVPAVALVKDYIVEASLSENRWRIVSAERIPTSAFSDALFQTAETSFVMDSLDDAERFIGVPFPENDVIANATPISIDMQLAAKKVQNVSCAVSLHYINDDDAQDGADRKLGIVWTQAWYKLHGNRVRMEYWMRTEHVRKDAAFGIEIESPYRLISTQETYVTPHGRECEIFYTVNAEVETDCSAYGYVMIDGIGVQLAVYAETKESARNTVIEILDAFT